MPGGRNLTLFPKKPSHPRSTGKTEQLNYKCPSHIREYLNEVMSRGYSLSDAITDLVDIGIAASEELSAEELLLVDTDAVRHKISRGQAFARLAREGLHARIVAEAGKKK